MSTKNNDAGLRFMHIAGVVIGFLAGLGVGMLVYEEGRIARIAALVGVAVALLSVCACFVHAWCDDDKDDDDHADRDGKGGER